MPAPILTRSDLEVIAKRHVAGDSDAVIAADLGVERSTGRKARGRPTFAPRLAHERRLAANREKSARYRQRQRAKAAVESDPPFASPPTGSALMATLPGQEYPRTEVYEGDEQVSVFHTKEMAWCASFQLGRFGECRERFLYGVSLRCGVCPLFDSERAIRAGMREERAPAAISGSLGPAEGAVDGSSIVFGADLLELLNWQLPDWVDFSRLFPDFPPDEWPDSSDDQSAD